MYNVQLTMYNEGKKDFSFFEIYYCIDFAWAKSTAFGFYALFLKHFIF